MLFILISHDSLPPIGEYKARRSDVHDCSSESPLSIPSHILESSSHLVELRWLPTPIRSFTVLEIHSFIPFCQYTNLITMYCRMLGSVLDIGIFHDVHSSIPHTIPQIPPAPAIDQPEGHLGDIPPPVQGVAAPARVQDPHHFDVAYQGVVDYHPRPLRVSDSHLFAAEHPFDYRLSDNRTLHMYSPILDLAKVSHLKHNPTLQ